MLPRLSLFKFEPSREAIHVLKRLVVQKVVERRPARIIHEVELVEGSSAITEIVHELQVVRLRLLLRSQEAFGHRFSGPLYRSAFPTIAVVFLCRLSHREPFFNQGAHRG